jgi:putative nucleotidyltransferase with HDIG domain
MTMLSKKEEADYHLELARRVYQLETIQEISLQINANRNVDEILNVIFKSIIGTLGVAEGATMLYDPVSETLAVRAGQGAVDVTAHIALPARLRELVADTEAPVPIVDGDPISTLAMEELGCSRPTYWVSIFAGSDLLGAIVLGPKLGAKPYAESDLSFLRTIAAQSAVAIENALSYRRVQEGEERLRVSLAQLKSISDGIIEAMVTVVEIRDPYTAGHQRRVSEIAGLIAAELGMNSESVQSIRTAGLIHDIGKISIPAEILTKPGKITDIELSLIRNHAAIGYQILRSVEFPWPIAKIVREHHEYFDGRGYPDGLRGDAILAEARILKVADTVEAAASHRPYRAGHGLKKALGFVEEARGTENDPDVVDACLRIFSRNSISFEGIWPRESR